MEKIKDLKELTLDKIIEIVQAHKDVEWLKSLAAEKHECKDGKVRKTSFVEIRSAVVKRYDELKELRPKVEKKPTMYDRIANL